MSKKLNTTNYLTTQAAADVLGVSTSRVRQIINEDQLKAEKLGRDHLILAEELAIYITKGKKQKGRHRNVNK